MTETRFTHGTGGANIGFTGAGGDAQGRKRKPSNALFDVEFLAFLRSAGLASYEEDPSIEEFTQHFAVSPCSQDEQRQLVLPMNDLQGALSYPKQEPGTLSDSVTRETVPSSLSQPFTPTYTHNHRAVITAMPHLPQAGRAAAAGGAAAAGAEADDDDDTNSAATMPMPHKRRRTDDDEVTSSPNDLVEVPSTTVVTTASGTAATATSRPSDTAAGRDQQQHRSAAAAGAKPGSGTAGAAAAADAAVVKAILVAKVLTKSDANSKRVILPRIAVEANLPQLSHAQVFNLSATDPHGSSWPLVIKAWANGQNPKPVYVLEQVGELLKQYKITTGDALALLASQDGRFFLEWNTEAVRAAAARPTYSAFTFKQQQPVVAGDKASPQQQKPAVTPNQQAVTEPQQQQPAAAQAQEQQPAAVPAQQQQQQQQPVVKQEQQQQPPLQVQQQAAVPRQQQQAQPQAPLMTAVPVNSMPLVSGTFIPTSPCQLLVHGDASALLPSYLALDPLEPSLPASMMMLKTRSDAAFELPEPTALAAVAAGGDEADAAEVLVPAQPEAGENGALHQGGFLLCPRTAGCTRPAGHQGWCLGHKGYKKRSRA